MLSAILRNAEPQRRAAKHVGHTWFFGKRFQISRRLLQLFISKQESNLWVSNVSENTSSHVMSESQTPVQDRRYQSGPSARSSVIPSEGDFQRIMEQTNNDCRSQILILTLSPRQKMRFKTEVCTCSQFLTEAMLWIKEVEMVDSVDDFLHCV